MGKSFGMARTSPGPKASSMVRSAAALFGSRVDVWLPGHAHVRVALGSRVKGGASVLADVHPQKDEPSLDVLQESFA